MTTALVHSSSHPQGRAAEFVSSHQKTRAASTAILEIEKVLTLFFEALGTIVEQMELRNATFGSVLNAKETVRASPKVLRLMPGFNRVLEENEQHRLPKSGLESWTKGVVINARIFLDLSAVKDVKPVSVPQTLRRFLSVPAEELSCFDFAFTQVGDCRPLLRDYSNEEVPSRLEDWGYVPVSDPRPGDLVVYFNENYPMHMGVVQKDKTILSKWGNESPVAYVHSVESAPSIYGSQVVYYRRPV